MNYWPDPAFDQEQVDGAAASEHGQNEAEAEPQQSATGAAAGAGEGPGLTEQ